MPLSFLSWSLEGGRISQFLVYLSLLLYVCVLAVTTCTRVRSKYVRASVYVSFNSAKVLGHARQHSRQFAVNTPHLGILVWYQ